MNQGYVCIYVTSNISVYLADYICFIKLKISYYLFYIVNISYTCVVDVREFKFSQFRIVDCLKKNIY